MNAEMMNHHFFQKGAATSIEKAKVFSEQKPSLLQAFT